MLNLTPMGDLKSITENNAVCKKRFELRKTFAIDKNILLDNNHLQSKYLPIMIDFDIYIEERHAYHDGMMHVIIIILLPVFT